VLPFLKWPGGKRWLTLKHAGFFPTEYCRYIEPFLGSGAVFFFLEPNRAILGDLNQDLITVYRGIQTDWRKLQRLLQKHAQKHGKRYYYRIRKADPKDPIERAARLIYLNRTCFNGIYRVNLEGRFNVPKGTKDTVLFPTDDFQSVARLLSHAELREAQDFESIVDEARKGDFLFVDPPYTVRHNNNAFIKYNENLFSWDDQVRLAEALGRARKRGAKIVATNANHQSVQKLYRDKGFYLNTVSRFSPISASPDSRKQFEELIISANTKGGKA
jgi:DNA adenine methylase